MANAGEAHGGGGGGGGAHVSGGGGAHFSGGGHAAMGGGRTRALLEGIQALPERVQAALPAEPRTVITVLLLTLTMRYRRTTSTVGTPLTRALAALSLTRLDLRRAVRASPAVRDL